MKTDALAFVIPTFRLRDVPETVVAYDESFRRNGHRVPMYVFDDSSQANFEKYGTALRSLETHNPLFYVGPREKDAFLRLLTERLRDRKLTSLVRHLFRPSYGGNRNFTLMYTLGSLFVSADDDMRPYALVENSPESLQEKEVARGKLMRVSGGGFAQKPFDIIASFSDVLGKRAVDVPENFGTGLYLRDTSMDLETNSTKGLSRENSLYLEEGMLTAETVVKIAQTFRSGTNDIDALDFVDLYLDNGEQETLADITDQYVLVNFRPVVTKENWRIDCGVAGYDNRFGLPPFFPTRLRFEDYVYRLWMQRPGIAAAHVDSAQNHLKSNYMRSPLASEIFNEEICNFLKRRFKDSLTALDELSISFDYEGELSAGDSEAMLEKVRALHARIVAAAAKTQSETRLLELRSLATNLEKAFYDFDADFFQQNVSRIVDDVVSQIRGALELWPRLVEICFFQNARGGLPMTCLSAGAAAGRNRPSFGK